MLEEIFETESNKKLIKCLENVLKMLNVVRDINIVTIKTRS